MRTTVDNNTFIRGDLSDDQAMVGVYIVQNAHEINIGNNIFYNIGDGDEGEGPDMCSGINIFEVDDQRNINIKNNIFFDDEQNGTVAAIRGADNIGVDATKSSYNYFYNIDDEYTGIAGIFPNDHDDLGDPDFVEAPFDELYKDFVQDLFLSPNSPCIDLGSPIADFRDLNHTPNDLGIYGGSEAEVEMAGLYFGTMDAAATCDVPAEVPANYTLIVEDVIFTVDEEFTVDGTLEVANCSWTGKWTWTEQAR